MKKLTKLNKLFYKKKEISNYTLNLGITNNKFEIIKDKYDSDNI